MTLPIRESLNVAFVENAENPIEIARIITSLANGKGGTLYIGVKSNGKVKGVFPTDVRNQLGEIALKYVRPNLKFDIKTLEESFKLIVCIHIPFSPKLKYQAKVNERDWDLYTRIAGFTLVANKIIKRVWLEEKTGKTYMISENAELTVLLSLIRSHQPVTLSRLYQLAQLPLDKVDKFTSILVYTNEISMKFDGKSIEFTQKV